MNAWEGQLGVQTARDRVKAGGMRPASCFCFAIVSSGQTEHTVYSRPLNNVRVTGADPHAGENQPITFDSLKS